VGVEMTMPPDLTSGLIAHAVEDDGQSLILRCWRQNS